METLTEILTDMATEMWDRPNTTIAKEYGCSHTLVRRTRKKLKIRPYIRKKRIDWDRYEKLLRSEMTDTRIADIIGCDRSTVTEKRNEFPGEAKKQTRLSPGQTVNRIVCGNKIGFREIEDSISILLRIDEGSLSDRLFYDLANRLETVLIKMREAGNGKKMPLPPVSMAPNGKIKINAVFGFRRNVKKRSSINHVIRKNISGGEIFLDVMTKLHTIQHSRSTSDPVLDELLENLRFSRDKMADVIMDFVSQENKK